MDTRRNPTALNVDPGHILPLALSSSPGPTPSVSIYASPAISRRDSNHDMNSSEAGPSGISSTPRSSTSTTSSRNGWSSNGKMEDAESSPEQIGGWWGNTGGGQYIPLSRRGKGKARADESDLWSLSRLFEVLGLSAGRDRRRRRGTRREWDKVSDGGYSHRRGDGGWRGLLLSLLPRTPTTIAGFLLCFTMFAAFVTMSLKYILNPDKKALPWRRYCTAEYPTLFSLQDPSRPNQFPYSKDELTLTPLTSSHPAWPYPGYGQRPFDPTAQADIPLDPVGVFLGVFTMDSGMNRRQLIRQSYATHWRSRRNGTEGVSVRFIMGRPRSEYATAVKRENDEHGDIVVLDIKENMNNGKTHAYFTWAADNAMVPEVEWVDGSGGVKPVVTGERRPHYIVKADDDAFIMVNELERRLRVIPREKAFWGYLVKNRFMGGECYALSLDLVQYIKNTDVLRSMTVGKEDVLVSKWMKRHPQRESIVWASESCWIYDHPKAGTVYSHGFLYPQEVATVRKEIHDGLPPVIAAMRGGSEKDSYSSVTRFGTAYRTMLHDMTEEEKVEALVEGSPLSRVRDEMISRPAEVDQRETLRHRVTRLFRFRPSRTDRFLGDEMERGGTVLVHYVKRVEWFRETAIAMLGMTEEQAGRLGSAR